MTSVVWFRRDLRVGDQPTFLAAGDEPALALFVLDPALLGPSGAARSTFLYRNLRCLDEALGGRLLVVRGDPADVVPRVARAVDAGRCTSPPTSARTARPATTPSTKALADEGRELVRTGSPYAVAPGRVTKGDGEPFKVFTPFRRAWAEHGWRGPAATAADTVDWLDPGEKDGGPRRVSVPDDDAVDATLPEAGEPAALARGTTSSTVGSASTATTRDRPDKAGTSRMSPYLKYGLIHPRTMLADLASRRSRVRADLHDRDRVARVLRRRPVPAARFGPRRTTTAPSTRCRRKAGRTPTRRSALAGGTTGFPIVDAGMRQLSEVAWMHNRVRMIVASFLVKDLHLPWWWGARHFMQLLVDGDLASNQHGWQWTAGSGTDASPYFRVFNPITQGEKFDPDGEYVRRYVPELRGVPGKQVHQPWKLPGGLPAGYPEPMVDHKEERLAALARYDQVKAARAAGAR